MEKSNLSPTATLKYGSHYEEGKYQFIDEMHGVMQKRQGPTFIGGCLNLVRCISDKNNNINHRWADSFNKRIDKWGLMELDPDNRMSTWTNNQGLS